MQSLITPSFLFFPLRFPSCRSLLSSGKLLSSLILLLLRRLCGTSNKHQLLQPLWYNLQIHFSPVYISSSICSETNSPLHRCATVGAQCDCPFGSTTARPPEECYHHTLTCHTIAKIHHFLSLIIEATLSHLPSSVEKLDRIACRAVNLCLFCCCEVDVARELGLAGAEIFLRPMPPRALPQT